MSCRKQGEISTNKSSIFTGRAVAIKGVFGLKKQSLDPKSRSEKMCERYAVHVKR